METNDCCHSGKRKKTLRMANLITYDLKEFAGGNSLNIMAGQE
jgi:hypothetical protein